MKAQGAPRWRCAWLSLLLPALFVGSVVACGEEGTPTGPQKPPGFTISVTTNADTVMVMWTALANVDSFRAEITSNPTLTKWVPGDVTEAVFTSADGVEDGTAYRARVHAVNAAGETVSGNSPAVTTNFFPWDENYPKSLHFTRIGKATWYSETPNGGFEQFTGIPYQNLGCKDCHRPDQAPGTKGCESCHDTPTPGLGAQVDATLNGVCGGCHARQMVEANYYSDVHRDAGMTCMDCHTLEDVMGDGTEYGSMLEEGAIDAKCENCHTTLASNMYHEVHGDLVDCSACHVQSVVSCYNCHFESLSVGQKKAYGQFRDWMFLVNRNGKVHAANFQSVKWGNTATEPDSFTFIALAPFYAHTVVRNARSACTDCHNNTAMQDFAADSVIDVVTWDAAAGQLTHAQGVIPIPWNYQTGGLRFDFVDLDQPGGTVWSFLEAGADKIQLLLAQPFTEEQMDKLK